VGASDAVSPPATFSVKKSPAAVVEEFEDVGEFCDGFTVEHVSAAIRNTSATNRSVRSPADKLPTLISSTAPQDESSAPGTYLLETDSVARLPFLDGVNIDRLCRIGLLRVGDLQRVSAVAVADELRQCGVTFDMFESWQSQTRLLCTVPHLKPFDARILVACGIRDSGQLARMQPNGLRARVKDFAASAEGQAILMSGTEEELCRLTDWIGGKPDTPDSREPTSKESPSNEPSKAKRHRRAKGKAASATPDQKPKAA
jgi:hypothetical protein